MENVSPIREEKPSKAPRHPTRLEMAEIWRLERELVAAKRALTRKSEELEDAVSKIQEKCNAAPSWILDSSRCKWTRFAGPQGPSEVVDMTKERED